MSRLMLRFALTALAASALTATPVYSQGLGTAEFQEDFSVLNKKSYHDPWCKALHRQCRVWFKGRTLSIETEGEIDRSQLISFRFMRDGGDYGQNPNGEKYFYIRYRGSNGKARDSLFLFANNNAAQEFSQALARWYDEDPRPIPNYRFPASQGPQETHGRDKKQNPYAPQP